MARRSYSREDVQTHSDGFRPGRPAVNVKISDNLEDVTLPLCLGGVSDIGSSDIEWLYTAPEFTHEWIRANVDEQTLDAYFWQACEDGAEMIRDEAFELLGVTSDDVWQEGRSGGWLVVDGLPDLEEWDAVQLGRWRRFEKIARAYADDVMRQTVDAIYANVYEFQQEEAAESTRAANQDIATLERTP